MKKIMFYKALLLGILCLSVCGCKHLKEIETPLIKAEKQLDLLLADALKKNRIPRTINKEGETHWTNPKFDWTEGFFPGSCWYLFEVTGDEKWKIAAETFQAQFESHKLRATNHDLGFIFNCSFGNGYRLTKNLNFKEVMITAANALIKRFNPTVGCIQSWDVDKGWQSKRGWMFPVIIDNMMNLELLFEVSELTNNPTYSNIAIAHANATIQNHFREDNSSFHVVDYDPESGEIRGKHAAQGYSDESSWARGQAWGLYGFTVCYRYTKDKNYLIQAEKIASHILGAKNRTNDGIPFWDYDAPTVSKQPKDVSAATITASALLELDTYSEQDFKPAIEKIMGSLKSKTYTADIGKNNHFILKHSVGSIPHNNEIDVPLNYADYYYLEALIRSKNTK